MSLEGFGPVVSAPADIEQGAVWASADPYRIFLIGSNPERGDRYVSYFEDQLREQRSEVWSGVPFTLWGREYHQVFDWWVGKSCEELPAMPDWPVFVDGLTIVLLDEIRFTPFDGCRSILDRFADMGALMVNENVFTKAQGVKSWEETSFE